MRFSRRHLLHRPAWVFLLALGLGSGLFAQARAAAGDCIRTEAELRAVLALPGSEKSGRTYCIAPGRYTGLGPRAFDSAFVGIDPARPVTFEAQDPDSRPVLNMWLFSVAHRDQGPGVESGNAILRNLDFDLTDVPEMPLGQDGFRGFRKAIELGVGGITRNVLIERVHVTGSLRNAREGGREATVFLKGVISRQAYNVTVRDSRFERIVDAITLAGEDILIEGNRVRHGWGDMVRISPQVTDGACRDTRRVVIRNNMFYDIWSNNRLHPDVIHMFADSNVPCSIREVLIEGTLAFPGTPGLLQPTRPSGMANTVPAPPPAVLPDTPHVMHRLVGPGTSVLPPAECTGKRPKQIGLQLDGTSTAPVTVTPPPGTRLKLHDTVAPALTLRSPWETWRLLCRPNQPGTWQAIRQVPGMQGIFTNALPGNAAFHDVTIRHNILWIPHVQAISFRDEKNHDIVLEGNTLLRPLPGDLDGDGVANTPDDGLHSHFPAAKIMVADAPGLRIERNILTGPLKGHARMNDAGLLPHIYDRELAKRFTMGPGPSLMPTTPEEAVALARPRPGGILDGAGLGAVGTTPADDPYDWSWVADPW